MKIKKFLEKLASDTPTPGGGSAAALSGALSASLIAMVAGLSYKKGQPESGEMKTARKKALMIQQKLYRAIEEDAGSFDAVMEAFRLPRDEARQRLYRSRMIQKAYRKATVTPQKVCELSLRLLEFSEFLLRKGNQNAFSDTGVASRLAHAAFEGGMLNVRINLGSIRDKSFRTQKEGVLRRLLQKKDRLMAEIEKEIRSCGY
jgi:formiminotetrahydrofolate cyclodeaminase